MNAPSFRLSNWHNVYRLRRLAPPSNNDVPEFVLELLPMVEQKQRAKSCATRCILSLLMGSFLVVGCSSEEQATCESARELKSTIERVDLKDITTVLGPDFWSDVQRSLVELESNSSSEFSTTITELRKDLDELVLRLEDLDYDLGALLLSPATLSNLTTVTSSIAAFAANQLQNELDVYCGN